MFPETVLFSEFVVPGFLAALVRTLQNDDPKLRRPEDFRVDAF